jgi:hypothetical protein
MTKLDDEVTIPSEFKLSKKWDVCAERMLLHVTVGGIIAGLSSLVLFRKPLLIFFNHS